MKAVPFEILIALKILDKEASLDAPGMLVTIVSLKIKVTCQGGGHLNERQNVQSFSILHFLSSFIVIFQLFGIQSGSSFKL